MGSYYSGIWILSDNRGNNTSDVQNSHFQTEIHWCNQFYSDNVYIYTVIVWDG